MAPRAARVSRAPRAPRRGASWATAAPRPEAVASPLSTNRTRRVPPRTNRTRTPPLPGTNRTHTPPLPSTNRTHTNSPPPCTPGAWRRWAPHPATTATHRSRSTRDCSCWGCSQRSVGDFTPTPSPLRPPPPPLPLLQWAVILSPEREASRYWRGPETLPPLPTVAPTRVPTVHSVLYTHATPLLAPCRSRCCGPTG